MNTIIGESGSAPKGTATVTADEKNSVVMNEGAGKSVVINGLMVS